MKAEEMMKVKMVIWQWWKWQYEGKYLLLLMKIWNNVVAIIMKNEIMAIIMKMMWKICKNNENNNNNKLMKENEKKIIIIIIIIIIM
jgi:hypothetical protein